jgi:hypothetical protein
MLRYNWRSDSVMEPPKERFGPLKNHLLVALLQTLSDLDPRLPISVSFISSDVTLPPVINGAGHLVSY